MSGTLRAVILLFPQKLEQDIAGHAVGGSAISSGLCRHRVFKSVTRKVKHMDEHAKNGSSPIEETPANNPFLDERMKRLRFMPEHSGMHADPFAAPPRKSKLLAGIFSFLIPGTGHFYLGLMQKGLAIMLLFILNIAIIPFTVINAHGNAYIPFVVLLGCLIPVIYFYNLFDALQSTDRVNAYYRAVQLGQAPLHFPDTDLLGKLFKGNNLGIVLIIVGFVLFLFSAKPAWLESLFDLMGSYVGAVVLIGAGVMLLLAETRKR